MRISASASSSHDWRPAALLAGFAYLALGLGFGALAGAAGSHRAVVGWRLAAWVGSGIVFAAHVAHGALRMRTPPRATALHASLGTAVGALGLAAAANVHALWVPTAHHRALAIALVIWPLVVALPAFTVAFGAALLFRQRGRGA